MELNKDILNNKTLFFSRKQCGMITNIQWHVTDVHDNHLNVQIRSKRTDINREQIERNILQVIRYRLPEVTVTFLWVEWKRGHGRGVLVSTQGKTKEQVKKELNAKLHA